MPVVLINQDEEFLFEFGDAKIWYRRVPNLKQSEFEQKHQRQGRDQQRLVMHDMLIYATKRWVGFEDVTGKPVSVSNEAIAALPDELVTPYIRAIYAANPTADPTTISNNGSSTGMGSPGKTA